MQDPQEIFDVVNGKDNVIGKAPRQEVHNKGLKHRAVHIWLYNSQDQFLIQYRSPTKDLHPCTWDSSACGHVNSGEEYQTAAIRETQEELGIIELPHLFEIGYVKAVPETGNEFVRVYSAQYDGVLNPHPGEISELAWTDPNQLKDWMEERPDDFAPSFIYLWKKIALNL